MMSGHYRYSDVFQIYPSKRMNSGVGREYIDIEYNNQYENKSGKNLGKRSHLVLLKELVSLLSVTTNEKYEIYFDKDEHQSLPEQEKIPSFSDMSESLEIRKQENKVLQPLRYGDEFVSIDKEADSYFEKYFKLTIYNRNKYDASMSLYNIAERLFPISASMSFVTFVSSIESLMEFEREMSGHKIELCESCHQKKHEISKRFVKFIQTYSPSEAVNYEMILKKLYAKRSKMSHAGKLLKIDSIFSVFPVDEYNEIVSIAAYNRSCLFYFILKTSYLPPGRG